MLQDRQLTFRLLEYLRAMVAEQHITRASERLGVSQPKMSSALARLRQITGDPLLVRTPTGMAPTKLALDLAEHSDSFLERWKELLDSNAVFVPAQSRQHFRIYAPSPAATDLVVQAIERIRVLAPGVTISLATSTGRAADDLLEDGDIDLVIAWNTDLPPEFMISQLAAYSRCCIAAASHPRLGDKLDLAEYVAEAHVVSTSGDRRTPAGFERRMDQALAATGASRRVAVYSASQRVVPQIVAHSDLVAVVSRSHAKVAATTYALKQFDLPITLPPCQIALIWHPRTTKDPGNRWLRSIFREVAQVN